MLPRDVELAHEDISSGWASVSTAAFFAVYGLHRPAIVLLLANV
jgi:hypothetical protein